MRWSLLLLCLACVPAAQALEPADARHLLVRSGFQPTPEDLSSLRDASFETASDRLVDAAARHRQAVTPLPAWAGEPLPARPGKDATQQVRDQYQKTLRDRTLDLQAWWFDELAATPQPLTERMTLFWHDHFTSSIYDVKSPQLMLRQNQLLRENALGSFATLLHGVTRDPAMLIWLDAGSNRKGQPNENYAREVLELFTLGEGHYSEADIREAARAFTGWGVNPDTGEATFREVRHDAGPKTILGKTGTFDADGVIDLLLARPETAELIVTKLWREFVSPQPDPAAVQRLAANFRRDYQLAPLMKALLREPAFRAANNRGTLVKSPAELIAGTERSLKLQIPGTLSALASATMGQTLFNPPNVKGWPEGADWFTTETVLARRQYLGYLLGDVPRMAAPKLPGFTPNMVYTRVNKDRQAIRMHISATAEAVPGDTLQTALLNLPPVVPPVEGAKPPERLESWLLDPVYQLK